LILIKLLEHILDIVIKIVNMLHLIIKIFKEKKDYSRFCCISIK
jgi:hypothetical protein